MNRFESTDSMNRHPRRILFACLNTKLCCNIDSRDGSRFSNILFNYRISIRLCDYFLKVYQGLTIKTVRWREGRSDLLLTTAGSH